MRDGVGYPKGDAGASTICCAGVWIAAIDYRLRLRGIPVRGRTETSAWDPPRSFTDVQLRGPYRKWVHRHDLVAEDGGTRVDDTVTYAVPRGARWWTV